MCVQLNHGHSYKDADDRVCIYIFFVYQYMESTCSVLCTYFVLWVFVLHFMPKDLHFASIRTVYRVRQRVLTEYHYCTRSCFEEVIIEEIITLRRR